MRAPRKQSGIEFMIETLNWELKEDDDIIFEKEEGDDDVVSNSSFDQIFLDAAISPTKRMAPPPPRPSKPPSRFAKKLLTPYNFENKFFKTHKKPASDEVKPPPRPPKPPPPSIVVEGLLQSSTSEHQNSLNRKVSPPTVKTSSFLGDKLHDLKKVTAPMSKLSVQNLKRTSHQIMEKDFLHGRLNSQKSTNKKVSLESESYAKEREAYLKVKEKARKEEEKLTAKELKERAKEEDKVARKQAKSYVLEHTSASATLKKLPKSLHRFVNWEQKELKHFRKHFSTVLAFGNGQQTEHYRALMIGSRQLLILREIHEKFGISGANFGSVNDEISSPNYARKTSCTAREDMIESFEVLHIDTKFKVDTNVDVKLSIIATKDAPEKAEKPLMDITIDGGDPIDDEDRSDGFQWVKRCPNINSVIVAYEWDNAASIRYAKNFLKELEFRCQTKGPAARERNIKLVYLFCCPKQTFWWERRENEADLREIASRFKFHFPFDGMKSFRLGQVCPVKPSEIARYRRTDKTTPLRTIHAANGLHRFVNSLHSAVIPQYSEANIESSCRLP